MILRSDRVKPKEIELQYAWNSVANNQMFSSDNGSQIEVLYPGQWNVESGPDFLNARLAIDGKNITGDIEIHTYPGDWFAHGHTSDPKYKNVILHVVRYGYRSNSTQNKLPAIPLLIFSDEAIESLLSIKGSSTKYHPGLCSAKLNNRSIDSLSEYFSCIGQRRLQNKMLSFLSEIISIGPEASLLKHIFEACGYKNNRDEFLELYRRFSLYNSNLSSFEKEAVLWGESGFLSQTNLANPHEDLNKYVNNLWNEWWKLRKEHNSSEINWSRGNVRFNNSPWRRVAGLITFLKISSFNPLKALLDVFEKQLDNDELIKLFTISDDLLGSYLSFNSKLNRKSVLIGKARAIDIIGNIVLPFMLAYGKLNNNNPIQQKVFKLWFRLPISQSNINLKVSAQRWLIKEEDISKVFKTFSALQGAIYLYKNFCSFLGMDCSKCPKN